MNFVTGLVLIHTNSYHSRQIIKCILEDGTFSISVLDTEVGIYNICYQIFIFMKTFNSLWYIFI